MKSRKLSCGPKIRSKLAVWLTNFFHLFFPLRIVMLKREREREREKERERERRKKRVGTIFTTPCNWFEVFAKCTFSRNVLEKSLDPILSLLKWMKKRRISTVSSYLTRESRTNLSVLKARCAFSEQMLKKHDVENVKSANYVIN